MKTKSSIKNFIASMSCNIVVIISGLIAQAIFIKILGAEYLGINGLFTNIISMLGIVELGIGNAIIYNLYKPLVKKDYKTINSLMKFYKNAYHAIAIIVFILGMCVIPFLSFFVGKNSLDINITFVYILFILDIVCSYILSYKRSILYADQKNYIINIIHMLYYVILNTSQLLVLYITKNYYLYLVIKIVMRLLENIVITLYVNKKYTYINTKDALKLKKDIIDDIIKKVKALFFHKIGGFIVLGTDNLIISKFLGLITVGMYSNYYLIIDALDKLFGQAIKALTPSVGHMLVTDSKEKVYKVFKKIRFANFWIATFSGTSLLVIMSSFITIWVGKKYLLSIYVLITLVFNYYQKMMRNSYMTFKEAAGIYHEDRFVPLIESTINIIASIVFVKLIGLPGVFIGTIISGLSLWCFSYPKFVYKNLFQRKYIDYIKETIGYILLFIIIASITYITATSITINNNYIEFIKNCIISLIIPNILIIIIFYKTDNFKYYKNLLFKIINK
ncbi:MAG: oligosaccharide flippase family protein [Bacilli bacterium]|nr:oligosaccharide flippase family protein [Bacilli bacterium]